MNDGGPPMPATESARLAEYAAAVRQSTMFRLKAVPDGSENFRLTDEAMSFADIAKHLIDSDEWLFRMLKEKGITPIDGIVGAVTIENRQQYDELLEDLERIGEQRIKLIRNLSDSQLSEEMFDARYGREVSMWWIIVRGNLDHEAHHRGQIAACLRKLGIGRPQ